MINWQIVKFIVFLFSFTCLQTGYSNSGKLATQFAIHDKAKLQRGAKFFINYCSGCHSLALMRYNQLAKDLELTNENGVLDKELLINNLIFTKATIYDPIQIAMPKTDARQWFGVIPPDLSLTAREHGAKWLYSYLTSFYADDSRPFKANNLLVPNVAMPNILAPLAGKVILVKKDVVSEKSTVYLKMTERGTMNQQEFDNMLDDLVSFLVYVSEPAQLIRYQLGVKVILFLVIFFIIAFLLKKKYWKFY